MISFSDGKDQIAETSKEKKRGWYIEDEIEQININSDDLDFHWTR